MIKLKMSLDSYTLLRPVEVLAALPHGILSGPPPYRVLWALHSAINDASMFFEHRGLLELAELNNLAIVAPSLGNGFFTNSPYEMQADFLKSEFFDAMRRTLPLSERREDNFILGVSMGGFGALRWALDAPGAFAAAVSVSGAFDPRITLDERAMKDRKLRALAILTAKKLMPSRLFAEDGSLNPCSDLTALLRAAKKSGGVPRIALYHGQDDFLVSNQNAAFKAVCDAECVPAALTASPGGHDSAYWDKTIPRTVKRLLR
jgi:S-formylglutathione hydrolase FrmB